MKDKLNI
ncbi:Myristoylated protein E7, partial [Monkeypox virus]